MVVSCVWSAAILGSIPLEYWFSCQWCRRPLSRALRGLADHIHLQSVLQSPKGYSPAIGLLRKLSSDVSVQPCIRNVRVGMPCGGYLYRTMIMYHKEF